MTKLFKISLISLSLSLAVQTSALAQTDVNSDPELEQDYGPGFWDSEIDTTQEDYEGGETTDGLIGHEEDLMLYEEYLRRYEDPFSQKTFLEILIDFPQTIWNECQGPLSGNYLDFNCASRRQISVILDGFLKESLMSCIDEGLKAQGGGKTNAVHITHAGITGDARHSPKSLHAKNRAIDIKVLKVELTNGETRQFTYSKVGNRPFYEGLRKCWGKTVQVHNGCPLYSGNLMLTGSIGWENRNHGQHMHLSVPYCVNGRYGSGLWVR